ncbi:properdin-like isoform X2 [Mustelus asterias]
MNNRILLLITILCVLTAATEAEEVSCFSEMDSQTGKCVDLIGPGIEQEDCCLNINYCFQLEEGGISHSCSPIAQWTEWTEWSPCTVSCKEGVQQRWRICYGKGQCAGHENLQTRSCIDYECCAVDGGWSSWSHWTHCSVTCAIGQKARNRSCSDPLPSCGGQCYGPDLEVERCDTKQICPTHGSWSPWGHWASCGQTCQNERPELIPVRRRTRLCNNPAPSVYPPGEPCPASNTESSPCDFLPFCPISGNWGAWTDVSECSTTCGIGKVRQERRCDQPAPKHGGAECPGVSVKNTHCNTEIPCPVDGFWNAWSRWSDCVRLDWNISCRRYVGQQKRGRRCVGRKHDGNPCPGSIVDVRSCYNNDNCWYGKGIWSDWNSWSLCHPPCGAGSVRKRTRTCEPNFPDYPKERGVLKKVPIFFWGNPIFDCEELYGEEMELTEMLPCYNVPDCD